MLLLLLLRMHKTEVLKCLKITIMLILLNYESNNFGLYFLLNGSLTVFPLQHHFQSQGQRQITFMILF